MSDNRQRERREIATLTDEQIDEIAERAVDAAFKRLQLEVGRSVLSRLMFWCGCIVVAVVYYMKTKGMI